MPQYPSPPSPTRHMLTHWEHCTPSSGGTIGSLNFDLARECASNTALSTVGKPSRMHCLQTPSAVETIRSLPHRLHLLGSPLSFMGGEQTRIPGYIMAERIVGVDWNSRLVRLLC